MKMIKRIIIILLVILPLCTAYTTLAYESCEMLHIFNCEEWVSLREKPSTNSKRIMQLPLGALVSFVADSGDYLQVSYSGRMGYVSREYLRSTGEVDYVKMYVTNCKEWVSLWEEETTESTRVARIPLGTEVISHGRQDDEETMTLVVYNQQFGYVLPECLSLLPPKQDESSLISAALHVPDRNGDDYVQIVNDKNHLRIIEDMLRTVAPAISGQCPYQAQLVLTLWDSSVLRIMLPTDGCTSFFTTDGSVYAFPTTDSSIFWEIFGEAASKLT